MGKLFLFESKKNVLKLSLLFLLIGLIVVNFYKLWESVRYEGISGTFVAAGEEVGKLKMKSAFYGEITAEKIEEIQAYSKKMAAIIASGDYNRENPSNEFFSGFAYGDNNIINEIKSDVRAAYMYPNEMNRIKETADSCIEFFEGKSEYEVRKNQLIKNMYNNRKISVYSDFEAEKLYLNYEFSSFVIMILMIFAFSSIFSEESITGTDKIISSAGRAKSSFWAKQLLMYTFAAVLTVFFSLTDLLTFGSYYDVNYFEQPLYSISNYRSSPYNFTIIGAVVLSCLFKITALIFTGEVILTVSAFTKNLGASITLCFAIISGLIFINGYIPDWLSPFTLFSMEKMTSEFECMNVFGFPVLTLVITPIFTAACIILLHFICYSKTAKSKLKGGRANAAVKI